MNYNMSLPLYIQNSKSEICNFSFFRKPSFSILPSVISHSFLVQITPHKVQTSSFFHSFSFKPIEISNNPFKWWNHQRSERVLQVEANGIPRLRKRRFLPPFLFLIVLIRRTTVTIHKSFLFSLHY